jgi:hypothetical protein
MKVSQAFYKRVKKTGGEMDVSKVLAALRQERTQIEEVIVNLERLEQSRERRRGRPPAILTAARKRGRPRGSKNRTSLRANRAVAAVNERPPRVMAAGHSTAVGDAPSSPELV